MTTVIIIDDANTTVKKGITLIANLSNTDYVIGKIVEFFVNGTCVGNNTTDANGIARFYYIPQEVGNFSCGANFAGDGNCTSCNDSAILLVNPMQTSVIIDNVNGETGDVIKLNATLKDEDGNPIINKEIKFYLGGALIGTGKTNANGVASIYYTLGQSGTFPLSVEFEGDAKYLFSEGSAVCTIQKPAVGPINNTTNTTRTENTPINTSKASMKPTGTPIAILIILILSTPGIATSTKRKK